MTSSTSLSKEVPSFTVPISSPFIIDFKEMDPVESPDSIRDIVRMRRRLMRPVPLCTGAESFLKGVEEPVRMKSPLDALASTSDLTASHILGTSCHSSIMWGGSPSRAIRISDSAKLLLLMPYSLIPPIMKALFDASEATHVFPQYLGPTINTAPNALRDSETSFSTNLCLYPSGVRVILPGTIQLII